MKKVKVLFVCMGNICRSPTAQGVFAKLIREQGLEQKFAIDSAGTHAYHIGEAPDERAQDAAAQRYVDLSGLRARKVTHADLSLFDYILAMDRDNLDTLTELSPPEMQGKKIFNSPLPFVFNLDAQQIQQRYWVRQAQAPKPDMILVEAWPKRQEDRAQYKFVQIALDAKTYMPKALLMYAPNFNQKTAPKWDHYEFSDVKRNAITAGVKEFLGNFIPQKPPANWKILRDKFTAQVEVPSRQAAAPSDRKPSSQR